MLKLDCCSVESSHKRVGNLIFEPDGKYLHTHHNFGIGKEDRPHASRQQKLVEFEVDKSNFLKIFFQKFDIEASSGTISKNVVETYSMIIAHNMIINSWRFTRYY